jgi:hypothetical protein
MTAVEPPRVYFRRGAWYVEVDSPLSRGELDAVVRFAVAVNEDRWRSARPGEERERLGRALEVLRAGTITQVARTNYVEIAIDG